MKLCQKCLEAIRRIAFGPLDQNTAFAYKPVPESDCEFWAHKSLLKLAELAGGKDALERMILEKKVREEVGL